MEGKPKKPKIECAESFASDESKVYGIKIITDFGTTILQVPDEKSMVVLYHVMDTFVLDADHFQ